MRKYPSLFLTIILFLFLVGPFILKLKAHRLEIYPSIIMPSGSGTVSTEDKTFVVRSSEVYGKKNGEWVEIKKNDFLKPIPDWYYFPIREGHFGLKEYKYELKIPKTPLVVSTENNHDEKSIEETKEWFRNHLADLELNDSLFVVKEYEITFDIDTKKRHSKKLINEEVFELD